MARSRSKQKGRSEYSGGFAGIPRIVMDTDDYKQLSYKSKALLYDLAYQYRGNNNGDLTRGFAVMEKRGWKRDATVGTAIDELIKANLIIKTRDGRFCNPGSMCDLFALTWLSIDECKGKNLNIKPTNTPYRKFSLEGKITKNQ